MAEREVPAPTNYFDPAAAQTVISRYASARRRADSSGAVAEAESQALGRRSDYLRVQDDEDRVARNAVTQSREDEDYQLKKDADLQRGGFLRSMIQTIDPKHPDYNRQVVEFKAGLPPGLVDDKEINSILQSMNSEADDYRSQRNTEVSRTQTRDSQLAVLREKAKLNMSYDVTPEDLKKAERLDGSYDEFILGTIAGANKRANASSEFDRRLKAAEEGRIRVIQAGDLSKRGRERRGTVSKFIVEDRAAFPRRTDTVVGEYKKATGKTSVDPALLETNAKWRDQMAQAKTWDAKPLDSELSAAFAYDDPDKYVNLVPGLNDSQKERRRMVWEHAHKDGAVEESDVPEEKAPPAADPNQAAKAWLDANPNDPRAEAVRKKLGM